MLFFLVEMRSFSRNSDETFKSHKGNTKNINQRLNNQNKPEAKSKSWSEGLLPRFKRVLMIEKWVVIYFASYISRCLWYKSNIVKWFLSKYFMIARYSAAFVATHIKVQTDYGRTPFNGVLNIVWQNQSFISTSHIIYTMVWRAWT